MFFTKLMRSRETTKTWRQSSPPDQSSRTNYCPSSDIRDGQREALNRQQEHIELAREQAERMRKTAEESVAIQRAAVERVKRASRIVLPLIVLLLALVVWLIVKYRIL